MALFEQVSVIGVGLLGGSLGRACKDLNLARQVVGYGRNRANLDKAVELGAIDRAASSIADAVQGADLVVLCSPVGSFPDLARAIAPALKPTAVVTDVGSVKSAVVREMEALLPNPARFVGSHPIAGGEKSGVEASDPRLFSGALCVVTPTARTDAGALAQVMELWRALGMTGVVLSPEDHDMIFGAVSHLPHLVAFALMQAVGELRTKNNEPVISFCGNGLRDSTRIAGSDPVMWRDICLTNREAILGSIDRFRDVLDRFRSWVAEGEGQQLEQAFVQARKYRQDLQ